MAAEIKVTKKAPTPESVNEPTRKYTVLLTNTVAATIDEDVLRLRRHTAKRVDRSQVVRALLELLHEDESVYAEVARRITTS